MVLSIGSARKRGFAIATTGAAFVALAVMGVGSMPAFADTTTAVAPQSPTHVVVCGPNNDTVTTPGTEYNNDPQVTETGQFKYIIDPHGTDTAGTITVAAQPNDGYTVSPGSGYMIEDSGDALWTFTDANTACAPTHVTVITPTSTQPSCSVAGTVMPVDTNQYTFAASGTASATYETATAVGNVALDGTTVFGPYDLTKSTDGCDNPPPATTYDAVLWQTHVYNQKYTQDKITVTNESSITLPTIPTTCGTSWQGDVYVHGNAESAWLSATTSLAGPDGAQDGSYLAPGGNGVAYIYVVNDACPPTTPAPITCTVTGTPYTESGDHPPVQNAEGVDYRSHHDGHATGTVIPIHANAQGITSLSFTDTNVIGYGMFSRLIFNLSADGGPGYASFSVSPGNTIDQNAVAGVGSKNVLLGKTVAQVATAYPHNVIVGWVFQTGSTYPGDGGPSSDGATLTGTSGDCGTVNNVPVKPAPVVVPSSTTTVDCASLTQTTITTTTTKPQIWDASVTPPGYTVDTNSADWTVTSNSPGVTVALTSDQITKNCPSSTPTPTPSPTPSTSVPGGGTDGGDIVSSVHASSPVTPSNNGGLNLVALFIALMASVALFGGVVGGRRVLKLRTRSGQND